MTAIKRAVLYLLILPQLGNYQLWLDEEQMQDFHFVSESHIEIYTLPQLVGKGSDWGFVKAQQLKEQTFWESTKKLMFDFIHLAHGEQCWFDAALLRSHSIREVQLLPPNDLRLGTAGLWFRDEYAGEVFNFEEEFYIPAGLAKDILYAIGLGAVKSGSPWEIVDEKTGEGGWITRIYDGEGNIILFPRYNELRLTNKERQLGEH